MVKSKNDGANSPLPNFKLVVSLCVKNMCYNFGFSVGHERFFCTHIIRVLKFGLFVTLKVNAKIIVLKYIKADFSRYTKVSVYLF